jgi:hypothetical protein
MTKESEQHNNTKAKTTTTTTTTTTAAAAAATITKAAAASTTAAADKTVRTAAVSRHMPRQISIIWLTHDKSLRVTHNNNNSTT